MESLLALARDPAAWAALATLVAMEVVLGIDNLIFISILTNKLPASMRAGAAAGHQPGAGHAPGPAGDGRAGSWQLTDAGLHAASARAFPGAIIILIAGGAVPGLEGDAPRSISTSRPSPGDGRAQA